MGCFDEVLVPCPRCGVEGEAQSKGGELRSNALPEIDPSHYAPASVPLEYSAEIKPEPYKCRCGSEEFDLITREVRTVKAVWRPAYPDEPLEVSPVRGSVDTKMQCSLCQRVQEAYAVLDAVNAKTFKGGKFVGSTNETNY